VENDADPVARIPAVAPACFIEHIARRLARVLGIFVIGALARDVAEEVIAVALEHRRNADEALPFLKAAPRQLAMPHADHHLIGDGQIMVDSPRRAAQLRH
jgi:hypothetical protein